MTATAKRGAPRRYRIAPAARAEIVALYGASFAASLLVEDRFYPAGRVYRPLNEEPGQGRTLFDDEIEEDRTPV
ncbi:MAG: hypothetical protein AAF713_15875 [Pseudomonadota bacterium]